MSIKYTADVFCDRCGQWTHGITADYKNIARQARAAAKIKGWSFQSNAQYVDLCPACLKWAQRADTVTGTGG